MEIVNMRSIVILVVCALAAPAFCAPQNAEVVPASGSGSASVNAGPRAPTFECPEVFGDFEDPGQCDKFWRCKDGIPEEHYCEDGLVFDIFKADGVREDPCDSPFVIDCGNRTKMQEPSHPNEYCIRVHGIFPDPDPAICDRFYTCKNSQFVMTPCAPGLHFNIDKANCDWIANAGRVGCGVKPKESVNGFTCPEGKVLGLDGTEMVHPRYPHLTNCTLFYVCLNGETPRLNSCTWGKVYNEMKFQCESPELVPECDGWFSDYPEFAHFYQYDAANPSNAPDPGVEDTAG